MSKTRLGKKERKARRDAFAVRLAIVQENYSKPLDIEHTLDYVSGVRSAGMRSYASPKALGAKSARFIDPGYARSKTTRRID
jgi:hypothetical protein